MRVVCSTINEFLQEIDHNIKKSGSSCVHGQTIRGSIIETPLPDSATTNPREVVKFEMGLQASVVIDLGSDGQFLLEVGEIAGNDYRDGSNDTNATKAVEAWVNKIQGFCEKHDLRYGPGIISI